MTRVVRSGAVAVVAAAALAGCATSTSSPSLGVSTTTPAQSGAALAAYAQFWAVVDQAERAPAAKDWSTDLGEVAADQALATAQKDIVNYMSLPAHVVGTVKRNPIVADTNANHVTISDCVDLGDSRLVSDTDGKVLDDLANRVDRYRFHADVERQSDGAWKVVSTSPNLADKC